MITDVLCTQYFKELEKLAGDQKFLPRNTILKVTGPLSYKASWDMVGLALSLKTDLSDYPTNMKKLLKPQTMKKAIAQAKVCDPNNASQVYLVFLASSFYSTVIYQLFRVARDDRARFEKDTNKGFQALGFTKQADARLADLVDLLDKSEDEFKNIDFSKDSSKLLYLRSAILKIAGLL